MPLTSWRTNTTALFHELQRRGLMTGNEADQIWRIAEKATGIKLSPTDTPEMAAAAFLKALGVKVA